MSERPLLKVELDIYSGRRNPSWTLDEEKNKEFFEFAGWKEMMLHESAEDQLGLGYRGYVITMLSPPTKSDISLPNRFRIMGASKQNFPSVANTIKNNLDPKDIVDRENWLLETSGRLVPPELKTYVNDKIRSQKLAPVESIRDSQAESFKGAADLRDCNIINPPYTPNFWNGDSFVRGNNNCYNYATNYRSDTFAQPGRASGLWLEMPENTCSYATQGAISDGIKPRCDRSGTVSEMALVIAPPSLLPGGDFHWYRKDSVFGKWSHKPGATAVKDTDNSGDHIRDPERCDRGDYTDFCGWYFRVPFTRVS